MEKLIAELFEKGVYLSKNGDKLNVEFNSDSIPDDLLQQIKKNKNALLDHLSRRFTKSDYKDITPVDGPGPFKLSSGQRRLWIVSQFEGGSAAYNTPGSIYLNQDIDIENFKRAIDSTIDRHEILRTVFREDESGEVRQWILQRKEVGFTVDYQDYRKEVDKKEKAEAWIAADAYRAFDLSKGPLLRAALLRVDEEEYVFYFNMHHIISDGWSMEVLSKDVFKYYEAYKAGKAPELKELRIQYKDYSAWQLAQLKGDSFKVHREYWLDKLSGELPLLDLPANKHRPQVKTYNGQCLAANVDKATTAKLKGYIQENGGSLFMGLLASWNVLMYRYTSQKDIIIGTPVAGRDHADLEDQIGFYVNTLVLRNEVNPEESFNNFYESLKEQTLKSYSHQMYPFNGLVEDLNLRRDTSRNAVFDVMLILQNNGETIEGVELSEEKLNQIIDQGYSASKFDIEITAQEIGDYLSLKFVFNPDVYEKAMVEGLIRHYKQLLTALLETPEEKISTIDYLSEEEKHKLLVTYNGTAVAYPNDKTIVDLFEEQVAKTPDNVAVVFEDIELSYRELNERSNQLAHYLRDQGVREETLMPICMERGVEMLIGILAILKAGGAYVPIDPAYPRERISYILADTAARLVVTTIESESALPADYTGQLVVVDRDWPVISQQPITPPATGLSSANLAYIIYTSGSTGRPKGVLIQHYNVVRLFFNETPLYDFNERDTWTLFHSFSFDFSVWEMYGAFFYGGRLVIVPKTIARDVNAFTDLLIEQKVTVLNQTPSAFYTLQECMAGKVVQLPLRYVIFGGEALNPAKIKPWKQQFPFCRLVNMYGITETTVHVTYQELGVEHLDNGSSVIGKAIPTLTIFILDNAQQLVAPGVAGEICVGGAGLARGYLNQPVLTAEKFIDHPFAEGERLYRSGDLGRWLPDGNLEYLGRIDNQVKVRGHRIEPGEIEHALEQNKEISQAVVIVKENESGEKELVAYITSGVEQNTSELRAYLKQTLPEYMLPAYFVQLEVMPLTANGKVDKKSLPDPEGLGLTSGVEYVAPGTEQEKMLASVWSDVLKREGIGIKDSFYNLGGDSIKSIQVVARLKQQGYRLKIEHLLRTPVLEELAPLMELTTQVSDQSEVSGEVVLTPIQEWFFKAAEIKVHDHYNQSVLLYSKDELDRNILEKSIDDLTVHHDALRMVYKHTPEGWQQYNQDARSGRYTLDFYDLRESDNAPGEMTRLGEVLQSSINLSEGPLLRVAHFRLKDGDRLGLIIHHLVVDGVSWRILLEDLSNLYSSYKKGEEPRLPSKTDSFQRWALLQKEYAAGKKLAKERAYWQQVCDQQIAALPQDKAVKQGQAAAIDSSESFRLDKLTTELLQTRVHGVYNTEINDVLLTSLGLAIKEVLPVDKSVLQMEGHGREEIIDGVDISRTVGWFTTVYPFVLDVSSSSHQTESLVAVKESLRRVPNKGIGYGILTHLSQEGLESKLTPQITFNYFGDFGTNVSNDKGSLFEYASERIGSDGSKENRMDAVLDVSGILVRGELGMSIRYSSSRYDEATIKKLAESYKKNLQSLIETLSRADASFLTPSDLTFKGLSQQELSKINPDNTLEDVYELSPLQEGIYYHWLAETSSSLYFEQTSYRVRAKVLDIDKLDIAYQGLTARHAVLRTSFSTEYAGRSLQIVRKEVPNNFTYEKIHIGSDREARVELIKQQDRQRGFDLSRGSQMRLHVIDLSEGEYEFIWSSHHILMDGWCVSVLINDFNELLSAAIKGITADLQPVMPYSSYINWLKTIDRESSISYWKDYLKGYSSLAQIPFKAETADTTYFESSELLQIGGDLFKKVDALCSGLGITHNTFLQGVWGYLLSRYNNTNDVVFGAVVSGRPADLPGVEEMIGLFINTIPVRVKYDPDDTPVELLQSLQEQSIRSTFHHYLNLSEVQSQSEPGMELIDHIMVFENYAVKELESEGVFNTESKERLSIESVEVFERTNYDFNILIVPSPVSLKIHFTYNTNRFDNTSIKNLVTHFDKLIAAFAQNADHSLNTINYLSSEEEHELLFAFNDIEVAYPKDKTTVDLFEEQAAKTPNKTALVFESREISYQELNERSNQLAHYLKDNYKIKPDDLVGFQLARNENMIITILAILKAGAAYIPIDLDSPEEKIKYIANDSKCSLIIDEKKLDVFIADSAMYQKTNLPKELSPGNLIYAIYTSGSTGLPKGVLIEHRSIIAHIFNVKNLYGVSAESRFLQFFNVAFDAAAQEIFTTLCFGATLYMKTNNVDPEYIYDLLSKYKITHADFSTAFFNSLITTFNPETFSHKLEFCAIGGEKLEKGALEKQWHNISNFTEKFYNVYGPTETTLTATWFPIMIQGKLSNFEAVIPIGKSYAGRQVLILDVNQNLLPIGVTGEICIGGNSLARGYLNREELTKEKFIVNPFKEGERLYRTGDLGRRLADGNIVFIGRKDDQVKIRGYRIELGEIEHALLKHEAISQAVVVVKENESGEKELVAYITSHIDQNASDLRAYLKEKLPAYMLPAYFVQLEAIPLTANGKIDKKSLPDPEGLGLSSGVEYVAPATEQEKVLASVWSAVLKREGIGIRDSFYNLGGDSIKSIQVVARLKQHGYRLKIEHLLSTPVLEELARLMELTAQLTDQSEVSGEVVLTPIQEWFFKAAEIKVHDHFNQSVLLYSKDELDRNILEKSIDDLTRHHDALRMVYRQKGKAWAQFNEDTSSKHYTIDFYDLRESDNPTVEMARVGEELQSGIKLAEGPLLKVLHFRLQDGDRLGLIIHHLVVDGVSWRILLEDLSNLYSGYKKGEKPGLPLKTDSFQRWALLQKEYAAGKKLERERAYWQQVCDQRIAGLAQDKVVEAGEAAVIDSGESFSLDKQTTELLQTRVHGVYNTEINDVLLASLGLALKEVLSVDKTVLQMEGHGREEIIDGVDISRTVGWFTIVYPFVLDVSHSSNPTAGLVTVKEDLRRVLNKGIGYGILTHLSQEGLVSKLNPQISFNYLGDFGANVSNDDGSLFEYASERIGLDASKENKIDMILDVSGMLVRGELGMSIRYSSSRYDAATIKKLAETYKKNLQSLIETLSRADTTYLTPSDLSFKGLSQQELSKLNSDHTLEDVYELSPLQEGIYYHWLAESSSSLYFEQTSCKVRAKVLDIGKLESAYQVLTARHAVLRTSFSTEYAGRSLQIVKKEVPVNFTYEKLDSQTDQEAQLELIKQQDRERGFDLSGGSQIRLHVIDLSAGEYEFVWSHHHILMDGWCVSVLINDFNELLSAAIKGSTVSLPPVTPYSNYINWISSIDKESSLNYWKDRLSGYSSLAEIPFKAARAADSTYVESSEHLQIGGDLFKKVDALCSGLGITHNTFVQGVWGYLLSRYNNTSDVVFGAVVSGRPAELTGVEDMIGLFINTIPVRVKYDPDDTPVKLLKSLQEQSIQNTSHHYMNLSEVQAQSELGMNLIDHIMIFENYAVKELENDEGLSVESVEVFERTNYNFNIVVSPLADSLGIDIKYNLNSYDQLSLKNIIRHFDKLISEFAQNSDQSLRTLDYLSEEEKHKLLITFNDTAVAYPKDKTVVDLFEEQVTKTPDTIAIVFKETELTYRELNERSNQLAHYLRANYDIQPDDLVGIKQERSEWMIVSILGVLKSGGAYVPIDPDYPQERIHYIEQDTRYKVCVDETELRAFKESEERYSKEAVTTTAKEDHLAYVMYTSGSTGVPKGVMVEHRSIVRLVYNTNFFSPAANDKLLLTGALSFDATTFEIWSMLLFGGQLHLLSQDKLMDVAAFKETVQQEEITVLWLTAPLFNQIVDTDLLFFSSLRYLVSGGDKMSPIHVNQLRKAYPELEIVNGYGPTENTTFSACYKVDKEYNNAIPIGKPISNSQVYILDREMQPVPFGIVGEIYAGGDGLARGYLNQEALTKEKFIPNPFKEGERLYKTGDLGRWLADGNIEFIGRKDDQVKIRGYRIELGEIEHALLNLEEIKQAVVLAKENESGEKELVAYITSKSEQNTSELRAYLEKTLPTYMLPAYFVQLEAMPLTANGKIDKRSLPDPEGLGLSSGVEYVAPRTEQEKVLALVWADVLKRTGIGIRDSFYNLGGDSIKSIQVVARLKQQGYRLKVEHLLRTPVLEEMARLMELTTQISDQSQVTGEVVLTPIQEWFFNATEIKEHHHFNQSVLLLSKEELDSQLLEQSLAELTRQHDALRMVYQQTDGVWQQLNQDTTSKRYTLDFHDLREVEDAREQMARLGEELQSSISLSEGPLLRVAHLRLKDGDRLGLIIHHLVVDGVSWRILLEDLSSLYSGYKAGEKPNLPSKTDSFQRWALLQKEYAASKKLAKERAYWQQVCDQQIAGLVQDKVVEAGQAAVIDSAESFGLDKQTTELLQTRVHGVYNTEINDVLLASLGLALKEVLSADKSVLKMEGHGREEIIEGVDISRTVGWFTTIYPFVLDVSNSSNQAAGLIKVKEDLRRVPNKGIGYGILNYLSPEKLESKLTPEITFNYLGDFGANVSNDDGSLFEYASERIGSDASKENTTDAILDVSGMLVRGALGMSIRYSSSRYDAATIKKLAKSYKKNLEFLVEELAESKQTYLTPSDLSFKGLSQQNLSKLNSDHKLEDVYELSPLQEGIYYHWLAETSSSLYFVQTSYRVGAKVLDIEKVKGAYDRLTARHAVLRTSFSTEYGGRSLQIVRKEVSSNVTYEKLGSQGDRKRQVELIKQKDRERGFDLSRGSQMRLHVIDLSEGEYEFIWSFHHILMDGWCVSVLINDFNELLSAAIKGSIADLPPVMPYSNYINWLKAIDRENSLSYWKDYLKGYLSLAEVPFKAARAADSTYVESSEHLQIGGDLFKKVDALCTALGITHNTFVQGVWGYLLSRYNNTSDVVFGAVVSGRPADLAGVEDMIGLFINTIPVRIQYDPDATPVTLLQSLQEQSIESTSHHYMNLSEVQAQSELGMNLIDHIMIFENYAVKELENEGVFNTRSKERLSIDSVEVFERTNYDFNILVSSSDVSLSIKIKYNLSIYDELSLKNLMRHFDKLINEFAQKSDQSLRTIDYLSEEEKRKLLITFNDTAVVYPKDKTVVDLFEEQVTKTPGNIAILSEGMELTYRELNERSNQLAHHLRDNYNIDPDDLVGIQLERSEWVVISILGVLKAGGAYVPIDPEYPQERIDYIKKDSNCKLCLDETELRAFKESQERYSKERMVSTTTPANLAYVIYTSGSTGKPKGVMVEHASLTNYLEWGQSKYSNDSSALNFGLFTSLSFDLTVTSIFLPLISGGKLTIFNTVSDVSTIVKEYFESEISCIKLTPGHISLLGHVGLKSSKVQVAIVGGEKIETSHVRILRELNPSIRIYNEYGPTESTVGCVVKEIGFEKEPILIGCPISNTQIYILNENRELQPAGVAGEICIGGDGLARGYLNREGLTREKFIANPFKKGERIYKTGDLGRWLPDGNIEFIGRKDDQVKIRGYRIELGEIEHVLLEHEKIKQAIVLAKENEAGEKELVAYLTSRVEQNASDLKNYLKQTLPEYMLPAYFIQLEAMPLTANGKIDKKSLPDPEGLGIASGVEYVAPQTEHEKVLVSVWSAVLKRTGIGIRDSFYNLGGDSIKSIQVVARLKQHGYTLKVEHLLRTPVLEDLAGLMELTTQLTDQSEVSGEVVLTPIQEWFFKGAGIKIHSHFNQSVLLYSREKLDSKLLEKSIEDITRHHDALRMVYKQVSSVWQQFNQDTSVKRYTIDFYDLRKVDDAPVQMAQVGESLQPGIRLSEGPLLRVAHFRLKDGDRLGLIIHHLVVDGVSWRILLEDLSNLYSSYKKGEKPSLPSKTDSFQRWALLQKEYAAGKKLETERAYWQQVCDQRIAGLPQDKALREDQAAVIDSTESFGLDKKTTELLQTRAHGVYNTEINDVLLTSLGLAIKEVLSVDKSVLQMEGHGREEIIDGVDISRTVGWFTTIYPFVLDVSGSADHAASLVNVKEDLRRIPNKGIGYGILTLLSEERLETKLTPQISFNYLGDFGANVSNNEDSLFEYASDNLGSDVSKENKMDAILDVSGMLIRGELGMSIRYSSSRYDAATIKKLAKSYKKILQSLIKELAKNKQTHLTPSDLSFKGLSQQELSKINPDNTLEDVYELSPLQEGIYYHWLAEDSSSLYFEQVSYRVRAKALPIDKLESAYQGLTARHAVLRTSFSTEYAGRSLQIVRKEVPGNFTYKKIDIESGREARVELIKQQDRERGFDLSSGSQMRLHVIDLSQGEYEFIWSHHHILMDGWCMSVLINDFNELLSAVIKGGEVNLAPALPYSNYINWLRAIDRESSLGYWKDYLSGYSSLADIPFKAKAADSGYLDASEHLQIDGSLFRKVDALCNGLGITHNTFVQGVWGYLLSRYNNTDDVVFGAVVSGRPADLAGVEEMIGLFSNTIPVRVKYDQHDTPVKLLKSLQGHSIRSASHHYMNLSEVQSQSEPGIELMNHIMIFENYVVKELESEGALNGSGEEGMSLKSVEVFERTNYDFNIIVTPSDVSLGIKIQYNLNSYDQLLLKNMISHFDKLINEFAQNADQPLITFDYLSQEEKHKLLVAFNDTAVSYPDDKTIVDLFEEQAVKTPENIAVVFEDTELTYRELNERSNQLAHYLRDHYSIGPDDLVGIKQERSEWMIISILGVLKSGGAYVPIDMESPRERVQAIVEDSKCKVLLDLEELVKFRNQEEHSRGQMITAAKSNNLAYIIYTSGSTGKPKGVMIEHHNVTNFFTGMTTIFGEEKGTFLSMTNFTFDISVLELLWTLSKGYKVVIQGDARQIGEEQNNYSVYSQIRKHKVTHLQITPSMGAILNQHLSENEGWSSIKYILLGGEPATTSLVNDIYRKLPQVQLYNMYGPTETTIWSTVKLFEKNTQKVTIGEPIANTKIYILDENRNPVAVGVQGEIYIGGEGVARGYTNKELTDLSFIESPFVAGDRLYRTGDFGSWLNNGSIYCSGRKDQQVKVRGYRIELGEIEHALLKNEQIKEAVVISKENISGEKQLVAYITSQKEQNIGELRLFLKELLPNYMIPNHFVRLEELPLNVNGKVDRKSLPDPEGLGLASGVEYVAPRNEIETKLVKIWEEVLQKENVGVNDDFFALGGHSLTAIQLIIRIENSFGIKISLRNLLSKPTIDSFSEEISTLIWVKDKSEELDIEGGELII